MITNLKGINELMKEQEAREQHKHSLMERLESLTMNIISRGVSERTIRKALNQTDSLKEKAVIILRNISELNKDDHKEIDSKITEYLSGTENDIDQLLGFCEQNLKKLDLKEAESREGCKIMCLRSSNTIFDLTRKARRCLMRRLFRKTEDIDEARFDVIYLPLYRVALQIKKSPAPETLQVFVHAVNGGIVIVRRSEIEFKKAFSARLRHMRVLDGKETELKSLPEDKGDDIVVIREEISLEKIRHFISTVFNVGHISDDDFKLVYLPILRFYLKSTVKVGSGEYAVRNIYLDGVFGKVVNPKYIQV